MNLLTVIRQMLLFGHVLAFAIAVSAVLRVDLALLKNRRPEPRRIAATARLVSQALALLWLSGLALVALDDRGGAAMLLSNPKLAAKLFVVSALTANGVALHALAFPALMGGESQSQSQSRRGVTVAHIVTLGAISTASWLYASFIGVSRLVAPAMSFADFIAIYGLLLGGGIGIALVFVRPRMARLLGSRR